MRKRKVLKTSAAAVLPMVLLVGCSPLDIFRIEQNIYAWLLERIVAMVNFVAKILLTTPLGIFDSPGFNSAYDSICDLAMIILPVCWAILGLAMLIGYVRPHELYNAVPRVITGLVVMFFAPKVFRFIVEVFNVLSKAILYTPDVALQIRITGGLALQYTALFFLIVYLVAIIALIIYYAYRSFGIMFLVAITPIMAVLYMFPRQEARIKFWLRMLMVLIVTQVIHSLELMIFNAIMVGLAGSEGVLGVLTAQIGAVIFMLRTPKLLGSMLAASSGPSFEGKANALARQALGMILPIKRR